MLVLWLRFSHYFICKLPHIQKENICPPNQYTVWNMLQKIQTTKSRCPGNRKRDGCSKNIFRLMYMLLIKHFALHKPSYILNKYSRAPSQSFKEQSLFSREDVFIVSWGPAIHRRILLSFIYTPEAILIHKWQIGSPLPVVREKIKVKAISPGSTYLQEGICIRGRWVDFLYSHQ